MARVGGWVWRGGKSCCSYKRTTIVICCINFIAALYILRSLYTSYCIYTDNAAYTNSAKYTEHQIRNMEDSIRVRNAAEPKELIQVVKKIEKELYRKDDVVELPRSVKQKIADEILQRLKLINGNVSEQREALEIWRKEKLEEVKQLQLGKETSDSVISAEDTKMLERALESSWTMLLEDIGVWLPPEIVHQEHDDKTEGEEEFEEQIIPGRPVPPECHTELRTDYGGAAVRWGLTYHKETAADCCQACLDQAKNAKPGEIRCNIWVYCPSEEGCHSPDIYEHKHQECWLKQAENPRVSFKNKYSDSYRNSHPSAPLFVPWVSGVLTTS